MVLISDDVQMSLADEDPFVFVRFGGGAICFKQFDPPPPQKKGGVHSPPRCKRPHTFFVAQSGVCEVVGGYCGLFFAFLALQQLLVSDAPMKVTDWWLDFTL